MPGVYLENFTIAEFDVPRKPDENHIEQEQPPHHVRLRTLKADDAAPLFAVVDANRARLRQWLPWLDFIKTVQDEQKWLDMMMTKEGVIEQLPDPRGPGAAVAEDTNLDQDHATCNYKTGNGAPDGDGAPDAPKQFSATVRPAKALPLLVEVDGEIAGACGFNVLDYDNRVGFLGYWIAAGWEGFGLVTRCAVEVAKFGAQKFGLEHVDISAAVGNEKSQAAATRIVRKLEQELGGNVLVGHRFGVKDGGEGEVLYGQWVDLLSFVWTVEGAREGVEGVRAKARGAYKLKNLH